MASLSRWFRSRREVTILVVVLGMLSATSVLDNVVDSLYMFGSKTTFPEQYLSNWTTKSVATFATCRTINAILSVAEETGISFGVNVPVGKALKPVNDLVEKLSFVALASSVSLGIQRLLLQVGGWIGLRVVVTLAMFAFLVAVWAPGDLAVSMKRLGWKLLVLGLVVKLVIPVSITGAGILGDVFLERQYVDAQRELRELDTAVSKIAAQENAEKPKTGMLSKVTALWSTATEQGKALLESLKSKAQVYADLAISLMVVFIAQTMVLPLLILWLLVKGLSVFLGGQSGTNVDKAFGALLERLDQRTGSVSVGKNTGATVEPRPATAS